MSLSLWFRSPRYLLTLFLAIMLVLAASLGWLSWRLLKQDRVLESQRSQERLDNAADLIAASLLRKFSESKDQFNSLLALSDSDLNARVAEPAGQGAGTVLIVVFPIRATSIPDFYNCTHGPRIVDLRVFMHRRVGCGKTSSLSVFAVELLRRAGSTSEVRHAGGLIAADADPAGIRLEPTPRRILSALNLTPLPASADGERSSTRATESAAFVKGAILRRFKGATTFAPPTHGLPVN
jgi:hypothetical protein